VAKGPEAFRSISEAADELGVPQHVLRFWETRFSFIRPMKRAGGRRYYRPADIAVLAEVRRLLHDQGYTIKGVQKLHRELGAKRFASGAMGGAEAATLESPRLDGGAELGGDARERLAAALAALEAAKARLDGLLGQPNERAEPA
jgi:DNA-binding transcriptional MerR regulator